MRAKSANIDSLKCEDLKICEGRADIGYRFKLKDPDLCEEFDEGDVVGFFKDDHGTASIKLLDSKNGKEAIMAGVISRSAYLEATPPMSQDGLLYMLTV